MALTILQDKAMNSTEVSVKEPSLLDLIYMSRLGNITLNDLQQQIVEKLQKKLDQRLDQGITTEQDLKEIQALTDTLKSALEGLRLIVGK
jgi:hypothetical protein